MSNDIKTLADAQPGGRVRLGDALLPCPFCGAPAERIDFGIGSGENEGGSCIACTVCQHSGPIEFGYKENFVSNWNRRALSAQPSPGGQGDVRAQFEAWHREKFKTRWQTGAPTRDMHNGVYADNYGPAEEQVRWEAWQAALSAQPSPGGQDASDYWPEVDRILVDAYTTGSEGDEFDMIAARNAIRAALAARQPVGEPMRSDLSGYAVTASQVRRGYDVECGRCGKFCDEGPGPCQPVGELHLPADGFYKIVYDDAEVPDESFARTGALDAARRRFEQISARWNAHLFVRFAHNTSDCTVPNATPAQAVDLGPSQPVLAEIAQERARQEAKWGQQNHVDWTPTSAATDLAGAWPAGVGDHFKFITDYKARGAEGHRLGYFDILMEEVAEAHDEARDGNTKATRAELVQVAAVAVAWIECIDRRPALTGSQAVRS